MDMRGEGDRIATFSEAATERVCTDEEAALSSELCAILHASGDG